MTGHEHWEDAVGAYLLGALPEDERHDFEAHLRGCEACRREVEHLRVAADALPASPVQLAPPPELKDRIMAIVHSEAELLHAAGARADQPERRPEPRRRRGADLRRGWWSVRPALAVVATLAVLAVGVAGGVLLTGGEGTRTVDAFSAVAGAKGKLIVRDEGHSTLVTTGMPSAGRDHVYQVWIKHRGQPPAPTNALFDVRSNGSASVDVPASLDDVEAVLVTREPEGGSATPSGEPLMSASPA